MSEWKESKLGDICQFQEGYVNPSQKIPEYFDGPIKWLRVNDLNNSFVYSTSRTLSEIGFTSAGVAAKLFKPNTLAISKSGTIGRLGILKDYMCGNRAVINIEPKGGIDYRFVFYILKNKSSIFADMAVGSVQPNLYVGNLATLPILLPPLPEQRAIAAVLSSLDDKIDLLQRQNKTLEAMAEALFRQWFVEEADEGWEEVPLSSIATFLNGLACQKYLPENDVDKLPVLKIRELGAGISGDSDWATTKVDKEYIVENGDVIFAWSASLMVKIWDGEPCILNQHLFKVTSDRYPKWFYYMWCRKHLVEFISIASTHATTMGHIKRGDLDNAMVLIPGCNELQKMTESMEPLFAKQISNSKQIRTLESLRDTLLPMLMSGEVRVVNE